MDAPAEDQKPNHASIIYQPAEDDVSIWMLAMVGVGSAFIIFVVISVYLMCKTPNQSQRQQVVTIRHHPSQAHVRQAASKRTSSSVLHDRQLL